MIKCLNYWSLKDGLAGTHPLEAGFREIKKAGFAGIELCIATEGVLTVESTQDQCRAIRRQLEDSGLVCQTMASGMSWGTNPTSPDPAVRSKSLELTKAALQRAAWCGCQAYLFVPGIVGCPFVPDQKIRYDLAVQRAREAVEQLLPVAEKVGVDLCLENVWNGMFLSPLELRDFIASFKSNRLGVYFDVGNVLGYHQHPPHWIELLGEHIRRVHIKDFKHNFDWSGNYSFCGLLEGDVPWKETMAALRKIGYDKTMVAEMLPWHEGLIEQTSKAMDKILAM